MLEAAKRAAPGLGWKLSGDTARAYLRAGPEKFVFLRASPDGTFSASAGRPFTKFGMTLDDAGDYLRAKLTERRAALDAALDPHE